MYPTLIPVIVIGVTALIQSVLGVGVLLFGTPWLLVLGYDFPHALWTLLPASLLISCLQTVRGWSDIHWQTIRGIGALALPSVAVALWLTTLFRPPVEPLVALLVLTVAVMDRSPLIRRLVVALMGKTRHYLVFMGLVHGVSNLGGSLLTALVYGQIQDKHAARATIAAGYALFAGVQLLTLTGAGAVQTTGSAAVLHMTVGAGVFALVEQVAFDRVNASRFRGGLRVLLVCTAGLLIARIAFP